MKLQRKILFPTPVYFKDIPNANELNKYLFKHIKAWRKADPSGEKKTNSGFGWHSKTDMNKREEFNLLTKELFKMAAKASQAKALATRTGKKLRRVEGWNKGLRTRIKKVRPRLTPVALSIFE